MKSRYKIVPKPCAITFQTHLADFAGCGHIRVIFPSMIMNSYYSQELKLTSMFTNRYSPFPLTYEKSTFVTFQRSATAEQLSAIRHFIVNNRTIPAVYEVDDNLMDIPDWNHASGFYRDNIDNIKRILDIVPFVTVSTENLKTQMTPYCNHIRVIPNHLPYFLWGEPIDFTKYTKRVKILYAGSSNHFDRNSDRGDFSPELIKFIDKTSKKYEWIFVGGIPKSLVNNKDIVRHPWKPILELPYFLKSLGADIVIAPLDNNVFNSCKSNIKALESVALGIPLVASNIGPYVDLPGSCDTVDIPDDIEYLASSMYDRQVRWKDQLESVKDQLFWEYDNYKNLKHYVDQYLRFAGMKL